MFNFSAWGKVEIINVETAEETASMLSHSAYRWTSNMNEYKLKVGIFRERYNKLISKNKSISQNPSKVFKRFDEIMLNTISREMNFTVDTINPMNNTFGYQLSNGTYIGAIGIKRSARVII